MIVSLNGRLQSEKRAALSIHDRGFLYGDGVYETLRVYNGKAFLLGHHMARLKRSLLGIQMPLPFPLTRIARAIEKTVQANRHRDAAVRLTITRGVGEPGFDPRSAKKPTILITSRPFHGSPVRFYRQGIALAVVSTRRNSPEALPPSIKSTNCLNNILAKMESNRLKADEALMLNAEGNITEGTISNIFLVNDSRLFTPALDGNQLAGVTRNFVCQLAKRDHIPVREIKLTLKDIQQAEEVFLTSTLMEIVPVTKFIGPRPQRFSIGPTTLLLQKRYKSFTSA